MRRFHLTELFVCMIAGLLLAATVAHAEIYKYRDSMGNIHYTDHPVKKGSGLSLMWRSGNDPMYGGASARINISAMKKNRARFSSLINDVAKNARVHPELLHAVVRAESAYDPRARSRKGAEGLMQLMPATASRYQVRDSLDPEQNLTGGARYLHDLLKMFGSNLKLALAAYNAGENAVKKYGNRVPPYPETQNYVRKVIVFYKENRKNSAYSALTR
ncbi:MAG: lytic transglycosylase domain-containing protein [Gammaproteobacteria bacterium]|nr:lytic transglycosylase domain-containing protein [Gammaproteobacteria bacterium]